MVLCTSNPYWIEHFFDPSPVADVLLVLFLTVLNLAFFAPVAMAVQWKNRLWRLAFFIPLLVGVALMSLSVLLSAYHALPTPLDLVSDALDNVVPLLALAGTFVFGIGCFVVKVPLQVRKAFRTLGLALFLWLPTSVLLFYYISQINGTTWIVLWSLKDILALAPLLWLNYQHWKNRRFYLS
ncbi:hypothetical protein EDB95_2942 [Dinghuibacter silviterrae]|uniref:Uncharacterized protein n=2 Tax=Dinghuibacter silviterrae TaxID=1539049 RepID=A0A4R8DWT3_9BACT|nr:hypothetical protein EDB95_2942 [Dinghuibacter silviterrae]